MKHLKKALIWLVITLGLIQDSTSILFGRLSVKTSNKPSTPIEKKRLELEIRARYAELGNLLNFIPFNQPLE